MAEPEAVTAAAAAGGSAVTVRGKATRKRRCFHLSRCVPGIELSTCRIFMTAWHTSMESYPGTPALLVVCCCQAELIAGAQGVKLPKEFVAAASGAGLRSNALQQYMKLQARTRMQTATRIPTAAMPATVALNR